MTEPTSDESGPEAQAAKRTPLYELHRELGGRMVPFAGYLLPVQYEGILAEHRHTREAAGLFDVSHMGQAVLRGDDVAAALETLVPAEIRGLDTGRMRYTVLTNEAGGILDDLIVTAGGSHIALVVNAARKDADFAYLRERLAGRCELTVRDDRALLALQGPAARDVMTRLAPAARHMLFMHRESLTLGDVSCVVTRSGYTGEDGFEISLPAEDATEVARLLLDEPEVKPIGLGARDSLRLEAGLCLYGNDIDETTTPVEAALAWTIGKRRRGAGGFPGADVILRQLSDGPPRKRVGLRPEGRVPARAHTPILDAAGNRIGEVTSGGFGPTVGHPIAMGYVEAAHAEPGTPVGFEIRGNVIPGAVVALPFVPHRYAKT